MGMAFIFSHPPSLLFSSVSSNLCNSPARGDKPFVGCSACCMPSSPSDALQAVDKVNRAIHSHTPTSGPRLSVARRRDRANRARAARTAVRCPLLSPEARLPDTLDASSSTLPSALSPGEQ